ncbi:MAG TPA: DOMON-like domain-containing protein [Anaerolineales bacterium]|nr:DOMON-like domain-containing protein [Anaerolineales bacterium]
MVERTNNRFSVNYTLAGNLGEVFLPSLATNPARKDELWRTTCFELFLAVKGSPQYWEFNMSPSGDWNVYVMDAYRQVNMKPEARIQQLQFQAQMEWNCLSLKAEIDLNSILQNEQVIQAGITSVVQLNTKRESYWALVHPQANADFHLRDSFLFELPAVP